MPIGKMAYANSASGSTSITYNKPVYTGGTVEVNDYSEGESKYIKPHKVRVLSDNWYSEINSNTLSHVTVDNSYLGLTSIRVIGGDSSNHAITDIYTTKKGLDTTSIYGVSGTGAAVTGVTSTNKRLGTTSIYGVVNNKGVNVSKVTGGSTSINVGATQTTSVVKGLGSPVAAAGQNPFVNATVDADECLSWIEKPLGTTEIREASATNISVQNLTVEQISGVAQVASNSVTVATGALVNEGANSNAGDVVAIGVTTTTDSFAKKSDTETTVATGALVDKADGNIVSEVGVSNTVTVYGGEDVKVATGYFRNTMDSESGANISSVIDVRDIENVLTANDLKQVNILEQCNQNDEGAIKVLTGITSTAATKDVTLTKGTDETHSIDVAITVNPDKRS